MPFSSPISITVDNLNTEVIIPEPGSALEGTAVLDATASGDSAVTSVEFEYTLGPAVDIVIATATPTLYGWIAKWDTQDYGDDLNYGLAKRRDRPRRNDCDERPGQSRGGESPVKNLRPAAKA